MECKWREDDSACENIENGLLERSDSYRTASAIQSMNSCSVELDFSFSFVVLYGTSKWQRRAAQTVK